MIIDPWGEVLADAGGSDSPCIHTVDIGESTFSSILDVLSAMTWLEI